MATILVVDDHSVSRECTATLLRQSGYDVIRAANGAEALELLDHCSADLAILDVLMPQMNGLDLLAAMRQLEGWASKPVMLITGVLDADLQERGTLLGARDWMIKARFTPAELLHRVERNLAEVGVLDAA